MSVARIALSTSPSTDDPRDEVERVASIVRKYATSSVAVESDSTVLVDVDRIPWACDPPERVRRLGVLASSWTGRRLDIRMDEETNRKPSLSPFSVSVSRRPDETPGAFRERICRAADRLATFMATSDVSCQRWMLRLERGSGHTMMPLPAAAFGADASALERRLPAAALEKVTGVRLEARTRPVPRKHEERGTRAPVHFPRRPETLPMVS